jgi:hypothetical protein
MAKKPALTADEKFAIKFVKDLQKKGKPGDVQKVLDSLSSSSRAAISEALRKNVTTKQTTKVNTPGKKATPEEIKVRNKRTGKLVTFNPSTPPSRGGSGMRGGGGRGGLGFGGGSGLRGNVNK